MRSGCARPRNCFTRSPRRFGCNAPLRPAGTALRSRADPIFPRSRGGKFAGLHEFSGRGRLQPPALGGHRHDHSARRIPDLLHAVPGGNQPGHAAGDLRVSNADVRADRAGSGQRLDVGRLDGHHRSRADGRAADRTAGACWWRDRCIRNTAQVLATYARNLGLEIATIGFTASGQIDSRRALARGEGQDARRDPRRRRGAIAEFSWRDRAGGADRGDRARRGGAGRGGDCRRRLAGHRAAARRSRHRGARSAELRHGARATAAPTPG